VVQAAMELHREHQMVLLQALVGLDLLLEYPAKLAVEFKEVDQDTQQAITAFALSLTKDIAH
jgi:hypothetical protein